jgi:hypothetical protein
MRRLQGVLLITFLLSGLPASLGQSRFAGLRAQITGVAIPASRRPVVTFKVSDASGKPVDLEDLDPDSVKFTIAALKVAKSGETDYQITSSQKSPVRNMFTREKPESRLSPIRCSPILIKAACWPVRRAS